MADPSLNRRLDYHARRSGFAIGASMAVTIALLIGVFVLIFAAVNPYLSDFFTTKATPEGTARVIGQVAPSISPTVVVTSTAAAGQAVASPSDQPSGSAGPSAVAGSSGFQADYQTGNDSVNFRSDAGTDNSQTIAVLDPGTPLQSTGQQQNLNGVIWMQFTDDQGQTGWIRQIDVSKVS